MVYDPCLSINLPFGKANKHFFQLFKSILEVSDRFIRYKVQCGDKHSNYIDHIERVFAYELYRHWANNIESGKEDIMLNAEINKVININSIASIIDDEKSCFKEITLYPDMVLHHSHSDDKNQIMICEIKRNHKLSGSKIFGDLYKISCYMTKGIFGEDKKQYKYGVFVIVGSKLSVIKNRVTSKTEIKKNEEKFIFSDFIKDKSLSPSFKRIVCIAYDGKTLEYDTLNKIISDIK